MKPTFTKVYGGSPAYPIDAKREKWRRVDRVNEKMKRLGEMLSFRDPQKSIRKNQ